MTFATHPATSIAVVGAPEPEALWHIAFYKFIPLEDPGAVVIQLRALSRCLRGSILVADEGINGVLAGSASELARFEQALCRDPRFADMLFKRSRCQTPPFARIKVHRKPEIVALGIEGASVAARPGRPSTRLGPQAWREMIAQPDVVVIDNRNSFEYRLGHFRHAIDPGVDNFRDFPLYVQAQASEWKAAGKRVAMYCTGGIRCEKTSSWMQDMGLTVYELDGGILNYFQQMPDADKDWEGECFVFDNRIALDAALTETQTQAEDVYGHHPDWQWRLQRARRLQGDAK